MTELRQRQPREKDAAFLTFVRLRPCCACGWPPKSEAAHLRGAYPERGKRETGMGEKPDDKWSVPLCKGCHREDQYALHRTSERAFFEKEDINPFAVASDLYAEFQRERRR